MRRSSRIKLITQTLHRIYARPLPAIGLQRLPTIRRRLADRVCYDVRTYQHTACSLSALDAVDGAEGLFSAHRPPRLLPCTIKTDWRLKPSHVYSLVLWDSWSSYLGNAYLNRQGFVLQERILTPRILRYGTAQLCLGCNKFRACESFPEDIYGSSITKPEMAYVDSMVDTIVKGEEETKFNFWGDVVEVYTTCKLTKAEDKLIATSGIAKRRQPLFGGEYVACMERSFAGQQLWQRPFRIANPPLDDIDVERVRTYRGASWSCANTDRPIKTSLRNRAASLWSQ